MLGYGDRVCTHIISSLVSLILVRNRHDQGGPSQCHRMPFPVTLLLPSSILSPQLWPLLHPLFHQHRYSYRSSQYLSGLDHSNPPSWFPLSSPTYHTHHVHRPHPCSEVHYNITIENMKDSLLDMTILASGIVHARPALTEGMDITIAPSCMLAIYTLPLSLDSQLQHLALLLNQQGNLSSVLVAPNRHWFSQRHWCSYHLLILDYSSCCSFCRLSLTPPLMCTPASSPLVWEAALY